MEGDDSAAERERERERERDRERERERERGERGGIKIKGRGGEYCNHSLVGGGSEVEDG